MRTMPRVYNTKVLWVNRRKLGTGDFKRSVEGLKVDSTLFLCRIDGFITMMI